MVVAQQDTLNQVLNYVIPIIIFCALGYVLYKPFREPIGKLWEKISGGLQNMKDNAKAKTNSIKSINYE